MFLSASPAPQTATERLSLVIGGLIRALFARTASGAVSEEVIRLICDRVGRVGVVIQTLSAALRSGTLRLGTRRTGRSSAFGAPRPVAATTALRLPRGFAWLVALMPSHAAVYGSQLTAVLAEPEMAALLAASPRAVRTLKPLCRMLGVAMPAVPPPSPPVPPQARDDEAGDDEGAGAAGYSASADAGDPGTPCAIAPRVARCDRDGRWRRIRRAKAVRSHAVFVTVT